MASERRKSRPTALKIPTNSAQFMDDPRHNDHSYYEGRRYKCHTDFTGVSCQDSCLSF